MRIFFLACLMLTPFASIAGVSISEPDNGVIDVSWQAETGPEHTFAYLYLEEKKLDATSWASIKTSSQSKGSVSLTPGVGTHSYRIVTCSYDQNLGYGGPVCDSTSAAASVTINISGPIYDPGTLNIKPHVNLMAPRAGDSLVINQTYVLQAEAADLDDGIYRVEFYEDDQLIGQAASVGDTYSLSGWSPDSLGFTRISAVAYDGANAYTVSSASINIIPNDTSSPVSSNTSALEVSKYDIYYGDIDDDGINGDIYFYGRDQFILLHGDIAIPLVLPGPPSFVYSAVSQNNYSDAWQLDLTKEQLHQFTKATLNTDYFIGSLDSDAYPDVVVRGVTSEHAALIVSGAIGSELPHIIASVDTAGRVHSGGRTTSEPVFDRNLSNRSTAIAITSGKLSVSGQGYLLNASDHTFTSEQHSVDDIAISQAPYYAQSDLNSNEQLAMDQTSTLIGEFSVGESGAAAYTVPVELAPGTAGVSPQIAFTYNSQSGDGVMGLGWNLAGGSAISRCRQTRLVDAKNKPITWTKEDRFCLNGQRLLVENGGEYGSPGTTYKTEVDSLVTVTAHGDVTGHLDYFTAKAKDGSTTWFGAAGMSDSEWKARSDSGAVLTSRVMTWGIQRFEDSVGNYMLYEYVQSSVQYQLSTIKYGYGRQHGPTDYAAKIDFSYDVKPNQSVQYNAGYRFQDNSLLKKVTSYTVNGANEEVLREYQLRYGEGTSNYEDNLHRLTSINKCLDGICLPPLWFGWGYANSLNSFTPTRSKDLKNGGLGLYTYTYGDLNGDGRLDVVWIYVGSGDKYYLRYAMQEEDGTFGNVQGSHYYQEGSSHIADRFRLLATDVNADGRSDIALYRQSTDTWELFLSKPAVDQWKLYKQSATLGFTAKEVSFADLNGDGLADAYHQTPTGIAKYLLKRNSNPATSPSPYSFVAEPEQSFDGVFNLARSTAPGDFNKDGSIDYIGSYVSNIREIGRYYEGQSGPDGDPSSTTQRITCEITEVLAVALADSSGAPVVRRGVVEKIYERSFLGYYYSTCDVFEDPSAYSSPYAGYKYTEVSKSQVFANITQTDLNGDGLVDILYGIIDHAVSKTDMVEIKYAMGKGDGSFTIPKTVGGLGSSFRIAAFKMVDYDADGDADLIYHDKAAGDIKYLAWHGTSFTSTVSTVRTIDDAAIFDYFDATGDGSVDLTIMQNSMLTLSVGKDVHRRNQVVSFNASSGNTTEVSYEPLALSGHYSRIGGITSSEETVQYQIPAPDGINTINSGTTSTVTNADQFYENINAPFANLTDGLFLNLTPEVPVLELNSAMPVVTNVRSSSPSYDLSTGDIDSSAMAIVNYYYHEGKIQAGGRGFLGFEKLTTIDVQTSIRTETEYRLDWPFTGAPTQTTTYSGAGHIITQSFTRMALRSLTTSEDYRDQTASAIASGSQALGPLLLYVSQARDHDYGILDNGETPVGQWLSELLVEKTEPDMHGNESMVTTTHRDRSTGPLKRQVVSSIYFDKASDGSPFSLALGRLKSSRVTTERRGEITTVKTAHFDYYGSLSCSGDDRLEGLLCSETVDVADPAANDSLVTYHYYDEFGNKVFKKFVSDAGSRVSELAEYDDHGRFVTATFGLFAAAVGGGDTVTNTDYANAVGAITGSTVKQITQVLQRDKHGTPLQVANFSGAGDFTLGRTAVTPFGNIYFKASGSGAFERISASHDTSNCPVGTDHSASKTGAGGDRTKVCIDSLGRETRTVKIGFSGEAISVDTRYNVLSQVVRASEPYAVNAPVYWTETEYDVLGQPVLTRLPFNKVIATSSDSNLQSLGSDTGERAISTVSYQGLSRIVTYPDGRPKHEIRNALGEVIRVIERGTVGASYTYDAQGNMRSMTDMAGNVTTISFDALGRKTGMSDPDQGEWSYHYNGFGEQVCQRDANGQTITTSYDFNGRPVLRQDRAGGTCPSPSGDVLANVIWQYDTAPNGLGKVSHERDSISEFARYYSYDGLGRPLSSVTEMKGHNNVLGQHYQKNTYDQFGRTHQVFDAARADNKFQRNGVQNVYNNQGYLESIVSAEDTRVSYYKIGSMDARGNVTQHELGNAVASVSRNFNPRTGFVENISAVGLTANSLQKYSMKWDHVGNLIYRAEGAFGAGEERFQYDSHNRLFGYHFIKNGQAVNGGSLFVSYNDMGNITDKTDVGAYSYNSPGATSVRPHAVISAGNHAYTYDSNGNMLADNVNGIESRAFDYTAFNKIARITKAGAHTTDFFYGTDRSRYKRVDSSVTSGKKTTTLYIGSVEKIYHHDNSIEWKRDIGGVVLITQVVSSSGEQKSQTKHYYLKDHLGSITHIVDESGFSEKQLAYDPWGQRRKLDLPDPAESSVLASYAKDAKPITSRGFTGHEMVYEVGIIHMNGRIYDPSLGRFLQADPFIQEPTLMASLNRYSYVLNNPLNAVDPTGYFFDPLKKLRRNIIRASVKVFGAEVVNFVGSFVAGHLGGSLGVAVWTYDFSRAMGASVNEARKGAAMSYASAEAFSHIGGQDWGKTAKVVAHGVVGGVSSVMQGGKFGHGFVSAGFTKLLNVNNIYGDAQGFGHSAARVTMAALIGGSISDVTGGKFANGATSAAMGQLFNGESEAARSYAQKERSKIISGIKVYRKEIDLNGEDKYGHWWIEIDGEESYGWWPKEPVDLKGTILGVDGELNGQTMFGGTATMDPLHGDRSDGVKSFSVMSVSSPEQVRQSIRSFSSSYSGSWSWPVGQNCHTFQNSLLKEADVRMLRDY